MDASQDIETVAAEIQSHVAELWDVSQRRRKGLMRSSWPCTGQGVKSAVVTDLIGKGIGMTLNSAPNFTGSEPVQAGVGIVNQVWAMAEREDGSCLKDAVADAILADELGYRSIWFGEHHKSREKRFFGRSSQPELLIARLIGETTSIRLGTGVKLLPQYDPQHVAETVMTLNLLAPNRIDFGLGMGMRATKAAKNHDKEDDFLATLDVLCQHLSDETPPQDRISPWCSGNLIDNLWIASREEKSIKHAAAKGMNLVLGQLEQASHQRKFTDCFKIGGAKGRVRGVRLVHVCETEKDVWPIVEKAVTRMYSNRKTSAYGKQALLEKRIAEEDSTDPKQQMDEAFLIAGTPETVRANLKAYIDVSGIDSLDVMMHVPEIEPDHIRRSMRLFAEEVMPQLVPSPERAETRASV